MASAASVLSAPSLVCHFLLSLMASKTTGGGGAGAGAVGRMEAGYTGRGRRNSAYGGDRETMQGGGQEGEENTLNPAQPVRMHVSTAR